MDLEAELILSYYKEVSKIDEKKNVILLQHINSGDLFVQKRLPDYCRDICLQLKECNIKGIAKVYEVIPDEDNIIVIEEYVKGKTLQRIYDEEGTIDSETAAGYMLQLSFILSELHGLNPPVIHRDVKPENVILTDSGMLKLIDYDAAKNESAQQTKDTHMLGTQNFAAPEQYGFGKSDVRTDIYGLGSTINYLLTGQYPHEHIYDVGKLSKVIGTCLKLEADNRYNNMMELHRAIDEAMGRDKSRFLPVGFRRRNPYCMAVASLYYIFITIFVCVDEDFEGFAPLNEIIIDFSWFFLSALWFGDYLGCRSKLIGPDKWKFKNLFISILIWLIFSFVLLII